ncbi:hypothetical protein PYCCODRAFT_834451 [Trametes coccinea BRFM310]|uniref:Uncharacterized protein n=1 Tax=Trametes coccinea (strain BRFM310) TaxID=1353009 RepID=A0A1Y2IDY0_TRAC3|nr:hypothetical protein PYCCODRAFT_834451 [Trametes coccinea BRFM310]
MSCTAFRGLSPDLRKSSLRTPPRPLVLAVFLRCYEQTASKDRPLAPAWSLISACPCSSCLPQRDDRRSPAKPSHLVLCVCEPHIILPVPSRARAGPSDCCRTAREERLLIGTPASPPCLWKGYLLVLPLIHGPPESYDRVRSDRQVRLYPARYRTVWHKAVKTAFLRPLSEKMMSGTALNGLTSFSRPSSPLCTRRHNERSSF